MASRTLSRKRTTVDAAPRSGGRLGRALPYVFVLPAVAIILAIKGVPLLSNVILGFFDLNLLRIRPPEFVGLSNYAKMLGSTLFWESFARTGLFAVSTVGAQMLLGFAFALAINHLGRGQMVVRGLVLLPMMVASVASALVWRLMLEPQFGIVNHLLSSIGFERTPEWLSSPSTAMLSVIIVEVWRNTPFAALIFAAGLSMLPTEPYEAALVDGASPLQSFRYITLPLLRNTIMLVLVLRVMDALRAFDVIYVLTEGGPGRLTEVAGIYVFKQAFQHFDLGYGAVLALALFVVIMICSLFVIRSMRERAT